jgi:hypothetical protein
MTWFVAGGLMLKALVIDAGGQRRLVSDIKTVTNGKRFTEPEAAQLLDRLAPSWPLHLYDGAVIDHILTVINLHPTDGPEFMRRYRARRAALRSHHHARAPRRVVMGLPVKRGLPGDEKSHGGNRNLHFESKPSR